MDLKLDRNLVTPLYTQIVQGIIEQVRIGKLSQGDRLLPSRELADQLRVTRSTVIAAYRQLEEEGWVSSHVGRGTYITHPRETAGGAGSSAGERSSMADGFAGGGLVPADHAGRHISREELRRLMRLTDREGVVSLASGLPALDTFPVDRLRQAFDLVLSRQGAEALQYDSPEGYWPLREQIVAYLHRAGVVARPAEVLITSGTQQGATLVARVMVQPGDTVLLDTPTYAGALDSFEASGARTIGVPSDEQGILPEAVADLARRYHPRLLYVVPANQGPAAASLSLERRRALVRAATELGLTIVEDDSYRELFYGDSSETPLKALDDSDHVIHLGSFSKTLAPGLRVGYVVAGETWLESLADAKQTADLHTSTLVQRAVVAYLQSGDLEAQLERTRAASAERRQAMVAALARHLPSGVEWWEPQGGPFLWLKLPADLSAVTAYMAALEHGVSFALGAGFFPDRIDRGYIRLNFAAHSPDEIEEGVRRLGQALSSLGLGEAGSRAAGTSLRQGPTLL